MSSGRAHPASMEEYFRRRERDDAMLERSVARKARESLALVLEKYVDKMIAAASGDIDSLMPGDEGDVLTVVGGAWASAPAGGGGGLPSGVLFPYGGTSAPSGYLLCDGAAVSRSTYADLFAAIGTAYGAGNGTTTFNVPDMRGFVPAGYKSGDANFGTLGGSAGAATHTHTGPAHTHTGPAHTHTIPAHTHTIPAHTHALSAAGWAKIRIANGVSSLVGKINSVTSWTANTAASFSANASSSSASIGNGAELDGETDSGGSGNTGSGGSGNTGSDGTGNTGSSGTGNTSSSSSVQPSRVVNYIIKV